MSTSNEPVDLSAVIKQLAYSKSYTLPHRNCNVTVRELTSEQQKNLLATVINDQTYNTNFLACIRDIINTNVQCDNVIEYNYFDRIFLTILLRSFIRDTHTIRSESGDVIEVVSLEEVCKNLSNIDGVFESTIIKTYNGVEVEISIGLPSITLELECEKFLNTSIQKKNTSTTKSELEQVVTQAFIGELVKYVKDIKFDGKSLNLESFASCKNTLEQLPASLIHTVLEQASAIKTKIDSCLKVTDTEKLPVDGTLFVI